MNYTVKYTLYLIGCAAKDYAPDIPADRLDFNLMFRFSKEYQSENLVYLSLQRLNLDVPHEIMHRFKQCYEKAVVREARQELELQDICDGFAEAKIRHIPLKGSTVKYMYISPDMRQCGDIDILVDTFDTDMIISVMENIGYKRNAVSEKHITFDKGNIHVEVHRRLVDKRNPRSTFFENVWDSSVQKNNFTYEMSGEMLYLHLLTHLASHLRNGGAGIKLITDFYVFNKDVDSLILNGYLRETGLDELNSVVVRLMEYWFAPRRGTESIVKFMSDYILDNGVYGNIATKTRMDIADKRTIRDKIKYYFLITFRPLEMMKMIYPMLNKAPILLPLCYCHRILKKLTWDNERTKAIIKGSKVDSDVELMKEFREIL